MQNLARYNTNPRDTEGLDYHETILGHLVLERQLSFDDALYYLDSMARSEVRDWRKASETTSLGLWASAISGGLAFVSAGFGPVGIATGAVIGGIGCGFSWFIQDKAETTLPFRECEANLVRHHPWIRDEMKRLVDSGVPVSMVISRYDLMLKTFFAAGGVTTDPNAVKSALQPVAPEAAPANPEQPASIFAQRRSEREAQQGLAVLRDIPIDDSPIEVQPIVAPSAPTELQLIREMGKRESESSDADAPKAGLPGFIAEMSHNVKSSIIVGIPGAGKDLTIANILVEVRKRRPDLTLIGIDPKNDVKESGYYDVFDPGNLDRFKAKTLSQFDIQDRLDQMLERVINREDVLFFINEFPTLVGFCEDKWMKRFNARLQAIAQQGDSENQYLWIASQTGNLKELKLDSSMRSTLAANMLAIVRPGSDTAIAGLTRTDLIVNHDDQRMRAMMERSPVKRAYYYGKFNRWEAMPELPNLSGYDRDKRQWIGDALPPEPVSKETEFPVQAIEKAIGNKQEEAKQVPANPAEQMQQMMTAMMASGMLGDTQDSFKKYAEDTQTQLKVMLQQFKNMQEQINNTNHRLHQIELTEDDNEEYGSIEAEDLQPESSPMDEATAMSILVDSLEGLRQEAELKNIPLESVHLTAREFGRKDVFRGTEYDGSAIGGSTRIRDLFDKCARANTSAYRLSIANKDKPNESWRIRPISPNSNSTISKAKKVKAIPVAKP